MRALFLSAAASLFVATGSHAASTATLLAARPNDRPVVLDGRVWHCAGAACAAAGQGRSQGLIRECTRVARRLGPLAAYARDGAQVDRAGLERCNREARLRPRENLDRVAR
jgi:hypothetical protein